MMSQMQPRDCRSRRHPAFTSSLSLDLNMRIFAYPHIARADDAFASLAPTLMNSARLNSCLQDS